MKILLKLIVCACIVVASHRSEAANVESWSILSRLSGNNILMSSNEPIQITFSVTCTRPATSVQPVDIGVCLQAYTTGGINKEMHSIVYIKSKDFVYGGKINTRVTKTFTVSIDPSNTYCPNQTNVFLSVKGGVAGAPFNLNNSYSISSSPIIDNYIYINKNNPNIIQGTTAFGANAIYSYEWQSALDTLSWQSIGGTNATYSSPKPNTYYRRIVRSNSCVPVADNASYSVFFSVSGSLNRTGTIEEEDLSNPQNEVLVYPNPFSSAFTVQTKGQEIKDIEIVDVNGTMLDKQKNVFDTQVIVETNAWSAGIYFLRIVTNDNKLIIKKIVKIQ